MNDTPMNDTPMNDTPMNDTPEPEPGTELVPAEPEVPSETVTEPAKVMRIGSMVKQLLEEVRGSTLDEASRERLAEIYERSIVEVSQALSPDLQQELHMLALPFKEGEVPSESELRVAKAQLVGWLEGLFHGIQATLFAQQLAARQQLEQMRQLPPGGPGSHDRMIDTSERPGTYL
ncbi:MAG: bacterial proteasome activator family protein [Actinobacteria bacterium]|nr:bacterial proteasome activator family protein [Actinomycetota bacterium]